MNKRQKEIQQSFLDNEKAVLKKLEANYQDAIFEINDKIEKLMARDDANLQNVIYQVEYQKALKKQVEGILESLHSNEFTTVSEYLTKAYEDGFIGTMYDMQGQGIPIVVPIDQKQVVIAIQHETKLSEGLYAALGKDTSRLSKQIAAEISRGISNAATYAEIARNIASFSNIPKNNAARIARTEAYRIQNKATADAQWKAKEKGADVVKQWDSTLDGRTRDSHRKLDGQIRELDEPFEVDGKKAMQPGDFGDPAEDCNCRCALLQRARWALGNDFTKWDQESGGIVEIKAKDYDSFKMKYAKESERVRSSAQKMNNEDTINYAARRKERLLQRKLKQRNVDFASMGASELKDYANHSLKTEFIDMEGANSDFVRDAVKIIDEFEKKNGDTIPGLKVRFGGIPSGVYAKYDDSTNTLLLKKNGDIKAFEKKQIEDNLRYKIK